MKGITVLFSLNVGQGSARFAGGWAHTLALLPLLSFSAVAAAPSPEVVTAGYRWKVRNQEQAAPVTGGVFRASARRAQLSLDAPLAEDTRLTVAVRFGRNGSLSLLTGRRSERLTVSAAFDEPPNLTCSYSDPIGKAVMRKTFKVGGQAKPNFGWTDTLRDWVEHYRALNAARPLNERWLQLALELRGGRCRFLLDGRLLHEWTPTEDLYGRPPSVEMDAGTEVRLPEIRRLAPENPLYFPIDISARFNARGLAGEALDPASLPARGSEFAVGGVPFLKGTAAEGYDNLDIGQSWFREGGLVSYEAPHRGSFGGRWAGSANDDPTRFQFALPQRPYAALHLLAATDNAKPGSVPRLTAQFFRPGAGFPKNFASSEVPLATAVANAVASLPVKTASGKELRLWLVTIPVEPGLLQEFSDLDILEVELTKDVQLYRSNPDPLHYSSHAAGLPSAVRVFALTMGVAPLEIRFDPEALGNVWVEGDPSYRVLARNLEARPKDVKLELRTVSYDGSETNLSERTLALPAGGERQVRFDLAVTRYGHHAVTLRATCDGVTQTHERSLSHLRRREYAARPFDAKGFMFGYWNWRGGQYTPNEADELRLMGSLGMESTGPNPGTFTQNAEMIELARRYGIKSYWTGGRWATAKTYMDDPEKAIRELERKWQEYGQPQVSATHEPTYVNIFAEPGGLGTHGVLPEFYGEPAFQMDAVQRKAFERFHETALACAGVAKKWNPEIKVLLPWGDPCFAIPFLQADDKLTDLMDGIGVDVGSFDRLPEMQMHQCSLHRMYQFLTYWNKFKKTPPVMPCVEGPCLAPATPGALTPQQHAEHLVRSALLLGAYGVNRQFSIAAAADCAGWWGEQHYGGGLMSRIAGLNPHPAYSAVGALIRNLRHMEFVGWVPSGSLSVYCLRFRDSRDGKSMYALWTLRGRRGLTLDLPKGAAAELVDDMDNSRSLASTGKGVSLTLTTAPQFLYGAGDAPAFTLGEPDHGDSVPGPHAAVLGTVADLFPTQGADADPEYVDSFPEAIRRFPAAMQIARAEAPAAQGGAALSVTLPPQAKDRGVMPFYTTLKPARPVTIPGKGKCLTLWVRAASDWGRVVYVLRDDKGEKWTSVGTVGGWNSDDTPGASAFNFDGWRLVRFELPSHAPYDRFCEMGTVWWGSSGGDGIVDLPLKIEKLFIERRPKAMYVNSLEPTDPAPVLLGNLAVEYASAAEMGEDALARNRMVMQPPPAAASRNINPIAALAASGTLPAGLIQSVEQPAHYYDGTRGVFIFTEVEGAAYYDIWLSQFPDGRDALKLGSRLAKSGALVNGFRANTDFYAFLVYADKQGAFSKPSAPFKFRLTNQFGMK